jgi:hypothetical protein
MEAPGGVEPPTNGLGNRCSIHLSYGADAHIISRRFRRAHQAPEAGFAPSDGSFPRNISWLSHVSL